VPSVNARNTMPPSSALHGAAADARDIAQALAAVGVKAHLVTDREANGQSPQDEWHDFRSEIFAACGACAVQSESAVGDETAGYSADPSREKTSVNKPRRPPGLDLKSCKISRRRDRVCLGTNRISRPETILYNRNSVMKKKFRGTFEELQELVATTRIDGEWIDQTQVTQYRADSAAILNFWSSTKTVNFQGPSLAAKELEAAMFSATTGDTRAGSSQPNARRATLNDAGLQGLTRSIIKNRVGPVFDNESAFIAKVAEQCMLDLCQRLGLVADEA
jgi:hypothetical protein